jgi:D-serine deaminase-like pyridoxal phosphate-dependent protein
MHFNELDTPAVIVDLDIMERNMQRLAAYCREHSVALRPHTKTHKIPELAKLQIQYGACGITVAKVSEARVMRDAGIDDILIAYPIVAQHKARELAHLAANTKITVSLDSLEAAQSISLSAAERAVRVGILVEVDVGLHRCGVGSAEDAVALARKILIQPNLDFRGIMFYPGHMMAPVARQRELLTPVNQFMDEVYAAFARAGIPIQVVSGGSTPTAFLSAEFHGLTEIRPGMYPFYDRNMVGAEVVPVESCALSVVVTVVSTAVSGRVILDGGSKTFSSDRFLAGHGRGFGMVVQDPAAEFEAMSEEHGHLSVAASKRAYRLGERLQIIPNHVCTTINMHERIYGVRGGQVEVSWPVAGHGKLQ